MKKFFLMVSVLASLSLLACEKEKEASNMISYKDLYQSAQSDLQELQAEKKYEKVSFENTILSVPEQIDGLYELYISDGDISQSTLYDYFFKTVEADFGSEAATIKDNFFFNAEGIGDMGFTDFGALHPQLYDGNYLTQLQDETMSLYYYLYQTDMYELHNEDEYLLISDNLELVKMNRGVLMRSVETNRATAGWMPRENFQISAVATPDTTDKFMLSSEDVAIDEAVAFCEDYFDAKTAYADLTIADQKVHTVNLLETGDNQYAYLMYMSRAYMGVPFDYLNMEGVFSDFSDENDYKFDMSEVLMTQMGEIEYYYVNRQADVITQSDTEITEILPLSEASDIAVNYITNRVNLNVRNISFLYNNRIVDNEEYTSVARPQWRFEFVNQNDNKTYIVYIDAQNGECYYYSH